MISEIHISRTAEGLRATIDGVEFVGFKPADLFAKVRVKTKRRQSDQFRAALKAWLQSEGPGVAGREWKYGDVITHPLTGASYRIGMTKGRTPGWVIDIINGPSV